MAPFAEARTALEIAPWTSGVAYNSLKPDSPMRQLMFGPHGQGVITYLVDEPERRVDILRVLWWPG
ncbi:MAG: hypothetical protein J2P20_16020 [Pseudonocardia sp.]|nr:hypothetical protein [Pseudonocardia sp.]MBO0874066.1 hypothetical protein [Pseudonocardia sp.]